MMNANDQSAHSSFIHHLIIHHYTILHNVILLAPRMLGAVRRALGRSTRSSFPLLVRRSSAGPLRSRPSEIVAARDAAGARPEHVAVSRADAALRRRRADYARRRVHAAGARTRARRDDRPRP